MISAQNLCQFLIWSNLFFLVPLARALTLSAWPEATVLLWTTLVSIVHHGCGHCTGDTVPHLYVYGLTALLVSVLFSVGALLWSSASSSPTSQYISWIALAGGLLLSVLVSVLVGVLSSDIGAVVTILCTLAVLLLLVYVLLSRPQTTNISFLALASIGCIALTALIVVLLLFSVALIYGDIDDDLCFGSEPVTWSVLDFYTATSALLIVIVYALSIRWHPPDQRDKLSRIQAQYIVSTSNAKFAIFMLLATPLLVLSILSSPLGNALFSRTTAYLIFAALLLATIAARVLYGAAAYSNASLAEWRGEYVFWPYGLLAILFALSAFLLFFLLNNGIGHGFWHILAAAAIYFALESVHGRLVSL